MEADYIEALKLEAAPVISKSIFDMLPTEEQEIIDSIEEDGGKERIAQKTAEITEQLRFEN